MKKLFLFALVGILLASCSEKSELQKIEEKFDEGLAMEENQERNEMKQSSPDSVLRHAVYFSFKEGTAPEKITEIVDAFRDLQNKIPGIEHFEWGENSSPEGLNRGLTHAFTLTFYSDKARDEYLPHPDHKAFGALLTPHLYEVMVVDYWTRE